MRKSTKAWIDAHASAFKAMEEENSMTMGALVIGSRVVTLDLSDVDNPLIGVAKCNYKDTFDFDTGLAIASARMHDEVVPHELLCDDNKGSEICVSKLEEGEHFNYDGCEYVYICEVEKMFDNGYNYIVYNIDEDQVETFSSVKDGGDPVQIIN